MIGNNVVGPGGLRFGLGLVASGKRDIKSGAKYEKYFPGGKVDGKENTLDPDGTVYDTLKLMRKVVNSTLHQTAAISKVLKGSSTEETCENVWNFLYEHIQYQPDHKKREQLREPARSWRDRKSGIDCDCFSIFSASILTNLGIYEEFKMAAYSDDYQHVYNVIPKDGKSLARRSSYYVIDPVVDSFDFEKTPSKAHTENMKITLLSGTEEKQQKPLIQRLVHFGDAQAIIDFGYMPMLYFFQRERIPFTSTYNKDTESTFYTINTPSGPIIVPTVLTKAEANNLLVAIKTPAPGTVPAPSTTSPGAPVTNNPQPSTTIPGVPACFDKKHFWGRVAIVGGIIAAGMLLSGGSGKKTEPLNGPPAAPKKKAKQIRTIKI